MPWGAVWALPAWSSTVAAGPATAVAVNASAGMVPSAIEAVSAFHTHGFAVVVQLCGRAAVNTRTFHRYRMLHDFSLVNNHLNGVFRLRHGLPRYQNPILNFATEP